MPKRADCAQEQTNPPHTEEVIMATTSTMVSTNTATVIAKTAALGLAAKQVRIKHTVLMLLVLALAPCAASEVP
jgi:hypothetical protein